MDNMGKRWYSCSLGGITFGVNLGRTNSLDKDEEERHLEAERGAKVEGPKPQGRLARGNELTMQYKVQARGVTVIVLLGLAIVVLLATSLGTGKALQTIGNGYSSRSSTKSSMQEVNQETLEALREVAEEEEEEALEHDQSQRQQSDIGWAAMNATDLALEVPKEEVEDREPSSDPEQVGLYSNETWAHLLAKVANGTIEAEALPEPEPNSPLTKPETWRPLVQHYLWPWNYRRHHVCPYLEANEKCSVSQVESSFKSEGNNQQQTISEDVLSATSDYMSTRYMAWRGQLVNGTFYLSDVWPHGHWVPTVANTKMVVLEAIRQFGPEAFSDVDFVMNQWDTPLSNITDFSHAKRTGPDTSESSQNTEGSEHDTNDQPSTETKPPWKPGPPEQPETAIYKFHETPWPIFSPARTLDNDVDIPFPDFSFMYGPNNEFRTPTWDVRRRLVALEARNIPWEQRADMAIWSGHVEGEIRTSLKVLAEDNPDVLFVNDFNIYAKRARKCTVGLPGDRYVGRGIGSATNVCYMEFKDLCKFKYLVHVRGGVGGATYSNRLKDLLLCGSVVLYVEYPWREFFEPLLRPWEHYVPIQDLDHLPAVIRHLQKNDSLARRIGAKGAEFMRGMGAKAVSAYVVELFRQYSQLQNFQVKPTEGAQAINCPLDLYERYGLEFEEYPGFACVSEEALREAQKKRDADKSELKSKQFAEKERKRKKKKKGKGKKKKSKDQNS